MNKHFKLFKNKYIEINTFNQNIYTPFYKNAEMLPCEYPEIYNKYGDKMKMFFIRDIHTSHTPYLQGNYILWDRYNIGLNTHFYSHNSMLETMGNPSEKYGILIESRAIVPEDYKIFEKHKGLEKEFKYIFTYDDKILNTISNARFVPFNANFCYGHETKGFKVSDQNYKSKSKNISMVCSNKELCELHKIRKSVALKCKKEKLADTFGKFDGGKYIKIEECLEKYRFSIVFENDISDYYFTERLTNCFAAQTIPIYLGARKIDNFFNTDGIIQISLKDIENIENILKICTKEFYEDRINAIIDNYNRVQKYKHPLDMMYKEYFANK